MHAEPTAIHGQRGNTMIQTPLLSSTQSSGPSSTYTQNHHGAHRGAQTTSPHPHAYASNPSANNPTTTIAPPQNALDDNISILSFDDDLYDYDDHPNALYPPLSANPNHATALVYPTKHINATVTVNASANVNPNPNSECHDPVERRDRRIKRWLAQQCGFAVDLGLDFWDEEEAGCQCVYNSLHDHTHAHQHSPGPMQQEDQHRDRKNDMLGLESLAMGLRHRDSTRTMTTLNTVTSATTTSGTSPTSGDVSSLDINEEQGAESVAAEDTVEGTDGVLSEVGTGTGTVLALASSVAGGEGGPSQVQSQAAAGPSNQTPNAADDSSPHDRTGADSPLLGYPMPQPGDGPVSDPLLFPCANWVRELPVGEPSMSRRRSREKSSCCTQCHPNLVSLPNHHAQNHGQVSLSRERLDQQAGTMNTGGQAPILTATAATISSSPTTPHLNNVNHRVSRSNLSHKQSSSTSSSSLSQNYSVSHSRAPSLAPSSPKSSRSRPASITPSSILPHAPSLTHSRSSSQVLSISIGQALSLPPVQAPTLTALHVSSPRMHPHALASTSSSPASPVLSRRPSLMRQPSLPLLGENSVLMHSSHSHSHSGSQTLAHGHGLPMAAANLIIPPVPMTRSRAPSNASVHFQEQIPPSSTSTSASSPASPPNPLSPLPPSSPPTRRQSRAASTLFSSLSSSVSQLSELGMGMGEGGAPQHHYHQYPYQHQQQNSYSSYSSYYAPGADGGVDGGDPVVEARQEEDGESAMSGSVSVRNAVYIDSEEVRERLDRLLGVQSTVFGVGGGECDDDEDGERPRRVGEGEEDEGQELVLAERTEEWIDQLTPGADEDSAYFGTGGGSGGVHETPKKKRPADVVVPPNTPAVPQNGVGNRMGSRSVSVSRSLSRRGSEVKLGSGHRRGGGSGSGSRSGSGSHSGHGHGPSPTTTTTTTAHGWYQNPLASSSQVYLGSGGASEEGHGQATRLSPRPSLQRMRSGSMMNALTSASGSTLTDTHAHHPSVSSSLSIGDTIPLPLPTPPPLSASHKVPTRPPPAPPLHLDYLSSRSRSGSSAANNVNNNKPSALSRPTISTSLSTPNSSRDASPVELEEEMVFSRRRDLSDDDASLEAGTEELGRRERVRRSASAVSVGGVSRSGYDEDEEDVDVYRRYYEGSSEGHEAREGGEREEHEVVRRRPGVGRGPYGRYFGDDAGVSVPSPLSHEVEGGSGSPGDDSAANGNGGGGGPLEGAVSRWSLTSSVMAGDSHVDKVAGPGTPASTNPSTKGGRSRSGSTSAFAALGVFAKDKVEEGEKETKEKEKELMKEKKRSRLVSFISRLSVGGALSGSLSSPITPSSNTTTTTAASAAAPETPLPLLPMDAMDVYVPPSAGLGALLPPAPILTTASASSDKPKKPTQLRLDVEQSNVQGVVALNGEVPGVWHVSSSSAAQSRTHSLSDVTSTPPLASTKSAPGSPTTSRGRVTFKTDVYTPSMPVQTLSTKASIPSMASRPSFTSSVAANGSPKGSMHPPLPTSPTSPTMSSVPMPRSPMQSAVPMPLSPMQSTVPMPLSPSAVPIPTSPKSPMSLKSMASMASMELSPQNQALSTSPPQAAFMTMTQTQSKIVRTGSAQAFRTEAVVLNDRPTRPRASSAADLLMMMKPRPSVTGLMERAQGQQQQGQQPQSAHPLSQSSVPHHQYQQPLPPHGMHPPVQPVMKAPVLTKSMSMGVLSGSAVARANRYDVDARVPLTPSSFASTEVDDDEEDDEDDEDEDEDEEYGVELTGDMRKWGLGMGRDGERERDERERVNEERWERMQARERVFVPVNEQALPQVPFSTNPNRGSEEHTVTVYPNTVNDQNFNANTNPNINNANPHNSNKISGASTSLDINTSTQTAQHGSAFPHPLSPTVAKVESVFMALAPTRAQLQMKQQPPLPPAHASSTLQTQPFQRLRLKSMSSVGNLPSTTALAPATNNNIPLPTTTAIPKSKSSGFRGLAIRMGLVHAAPSASPVTPVTPNSSSVSPMPSPLPMGSNPNLLNIQTQPQATGQRELLDPYGAGYQYAQYDSPTSVSSPMGASLSGGGGGGILGTMKKARAPKRQLVISGVDVDDVQGYEAVKAWCESLGEVREIKRVANGSLYVDFKKASVAEAVCRLQAQVTIKGAGSVSVSWATKSKKKTI